ncbi:Protein kinase domain-containing protein [Mycena kentingensis (nom. inval.)]|nr:Protein kinase domain-containing protein [Mycena kentingensis (nom. inval.)]
MTQENPRSPGTDIRVVHAEEVLLPTSDGVDWEFGYTDVLFERGGDFYSLHIPESDVDTSPDKLRLLLPKATLVPRAYYRARMRHAAHATPASPAARADPGVFVKRSIPLGYNPAAEMQPSFSDADMKLEELAVCEMLRWHPHPNIFRYLGYVTAMDDDGEYISGLCFARLERTLQEVVEEVAGELDIPRILAGIRAGLGHLHALGYAHNDLNPSNIMLDTAGNPVLIDFDACARLGERLKYKKGTDDWYQAEDGKLSKVENDFYGLREIERWLAGERPYILG